MIAVIGGGLTGLALGHHLARQGTPHVVLEAGDRPGGVIRTGRVQGHLVEWGPQRARLTAGMRELVDDLGLQDDLVTSPEGLPLSVLRAGRLRRVPFSPAEFLRTDLLGPLGKLRMLAEPLGRGAADEESVADFFVRKIGREAYENLVGPLYGGLYASDPADMVVGLSLGHVLKEFGIGRSLLLRLLRQGGRVVPPPACSFREGMRMLPEALWRQNREHVRLGTPVHVIQRRRGGYRIELDDEVIEAEQVVVTTPARHAAAMLRPVALQAAEQIGRLNYNPLAVVHLHAETDLVGLGYQVSLAERCYTRGVTFNCSLFARRGVYTAYLGGARAPEVLGWTDATIGEVARREFREATGLEGRVLCVEREAMPAWDRSWRELRGLRLPRGLHIAANWESRPGMPGRLLQAKRLAAQLGAPRGAGPRLVAA
jgi:protoporphyrinogen/coproporphyrinogen III oxidase